GERSAYARASPRRPGTSRSMRVATSMRRSSTWWRIKSRTAMASPLAGSVIEWFETETALATVLAQHLHHPGLRIGEPGTCGTQPADALLEQCQRILDRQFIRLQPPHDLLQPPDVIPKCRRVAHDSS